MKINIECTEEQANLLVDCLEIVFRTKMNQMGELAEALACDTEWYDKERPEVFNNYIIRRDAIRACLEAIGKIAYGDYRQTVSDNCHNVSDMWSCLRHELYITDTKLDKNDWDVRAQEPIQLGTLPLIKVEVDREYVEKKN